MTPDSYIDFHAHHPSLRGERVIQDGIDTRGLHPWHLQSATVSLSEENGKRILAIGESGLDRTCSTPYDLQLQVFRQEVRLSEQLRKPLFLHCVRSIDDILRIRHELRARQPWIWHGFRGHATQLRQLLPHGFYFSFGIYHHSDAILACPTDRMLLETDDDTQSPISQLYEEVARELGLPLETLLRQMQRNYDILFLNSRSGD
ncbi:MAG: TatD family hydrolase [Bacteroidaceae bacterium]|nr:TatD family hydrolase [Bacteroidaceae bacterium]